MFAQLSYSSILLFNDYDKLSPDLIIISYSGKNDIKKDFIKIYNFNSGEFIKNLPDLNSITCFYLLSWNKFENKDSKKTYIIACCAKHIIIYDIYSSINEKIIYGKLQYMENEFINYYNVCLNEKTEKTITIIYLAKLAYYM